MFLIDDLLFSLFDGLVEQINREHVLSLMDYLKKITLMYERGLLDKEVFEERKAKILKIIDQFSLHEQGRAFRQSVEVNL